MKRYELLKARRAKEMSQGMLAKMVGVTPSAISSYERNVKNPSIRMAFKIADVLNESVEKLWGEEYKTKKITLDNPPKCVIMNTNMPPKSRLAEIRQKTGLTQKELANKSGVSLNMISYIERGVRVPRIEIAKKLCKALGVTLNDIWGNGG